MAFETAENIQNVLLNMVYTSVDILKYVYGIDEKNTFSNRMCEKS